MGFLGGLLGGIGAALNPVGLIGNVGLGLLNGGFDYLAAEADRSSQETTSQLDRNAQLAMAAQNLQMQKDFAQQGIRWRVADAEAAGLHPLAALGAVAPGYQNQSYIPGSGPSSSSLGNKYRFMSDIGQNLSRAIQSMESPSAKKLRDLEERRLEAEVGIVENQKRLSDRALREASSPPGVPSSVQWVQDSMGRPTLVPSDEFSQAAGGSPLLGAEWYLNEKMLYPAQRAGSRARDDWDRSVYPKLRWDRGVESYRR